MQRVDTSTAAATLPADDAPGTPGYFTKGDPIQGIGATWPGQDWCNSVQEEIVALIHASEQSLNKPDRSQMAEAVRRLAGANVRILAGTTPYFLSVGDSGIILVDATAGEVVASLPMADTMPLGCGYRFIRLDSTANAVGIYRISPDTINPGGATSLSLTPNHWLDVVATTASSWARTHEPLNRSGDTLTGPLTLNNGSSDTPELHYLDPINNTSFYIDMFAEKLRIFANYRGGATTNTLDIDIPAGILNIFDSPTWTDARITTGGTYPNQWIRFPNGITINFLRLLLVGNGTDFSGTALYSRAFTAMIGRPVIGGFEGGDGDDRLQAAVDFSNLSNTGVEVGTRPYTSGGTFTYLSLIAFGWS